MMAKSDTTRLAGSALRTLRERAGLSQRALAVLIGMSRESIQYWECSSSVPPRHEAMVVSVLREALRARADALQSAHELLRTAPGEPDADTGEGA